MRRGGRRRGTYRQATREEPDQRAPSSLGQVAPGHDLTPESIAQLSDEALARQLSARNLVATGSRRVRVERLVDAVTTPRTPRESDRPPSDAFSATQLDVLQGMISSAISAGIAASSSAQPSSSAPAGSSDAQPAGPPPAIIDLDRTTTTGEAPRCCSHLSPTTVRRIQSGAFVDLGSLLPPSVDDPRPSKRLRITSTPDDVDGEAFTVSPAANPLRRTGDLHTWLEAWTIYAASRCHAIPSRSAELLSYQGLILEAARRYSFAAVLQYDVSFRQLAGRDPTIRWDRRDVDLFTRAFTGQAVPGDATRLGGWRPSPGPGVTHQAPQSPAIHSDPSQRYQRTADGGSICRNYNTKGCETRSCRYAHCCFRCRGPHSAGSGRCTDE